MDPTRFHGLEFLVGGMYAMTLFSSCMSSPWTIENVGADPRHAVSAKRLVKISMVAGALAGATAAFLDKTWWPAIGAAGSVAYMYWLYADSLAKAQRLGYQGLNTGAGASQ